MMGRAGDRSGRVIVMPRLDAPSRDGVPLEASLRHRMETSFHSDFSSVRVHVGNEAVHLGAASFTRGDDIFIRPGHDHLIPHEAVHCVQQGATMPAASPAPEPLAANLVEVSADASPTTSGTPAPTIAATYSDPT